MPFFLEKWLVPLVAVVVFAAIVVAAFGGEPRVPYGEFFDWRRRGADPQVFVWIEPGQPTEAITLQFSDQCLIYWLRPEDVGYVGAEYRQNHTWVEARFPEHFSTTRDSTHQRSIRFVSSRETSVLVGVFNRNQVNVPCGWHAGRPEHPPEPEFWSMREILFGF